MRDSDDKASATVLLQSLIARCGASFELGLFFDIEVVVFPSGRLPGERPLRLWVDENQQVCLIRFKAQVAEFRQFCGGAAQRRMVELDEACGRAPDMVPLFGSMTLLAGGEPHMHRMLSHVCFGLGWRLQSVLQKEVVELLGSGWLGSFADEHAGSITSEKLTRRQLELALCKYQLVMLRDCEPQRGNISVAVDASRVGRRSRLFGALAL